jgi:hypothetical protein
MGAYEVRQRQNGEWIIWMRMDSHLALKVLHDVQENIVDIRPLMELDLDGIEVAKCIRDIELAVNATVQTLQWRLRSHLRVMLFL